MRTNTQGNSKVDCEGSTVKEVLADLCSQFPDIKDVLFSGESELHKYVNIYVDSDDIRYVGGLDANTSDAEELTILPAVAGGAF